MHRRGDYAPRFEFHPVSVEVVGISRVAVQPLLRRKMDGALVKKPKQGLPSDHAVEKSEGGDVL